MFIGNLASGIDHDKLTLAKELSSAGVEQPAVFKETGWFLGADGEWRFEVDDSELMFSSDFYKTMRTSHLHNMYVSSAKIEPELDTNLTNLVKITLVSPTGEEQVITGLPTVELSDVLPTEIANELLPLYLLNKEISHTVHDLDSEFKSGFKYLPIPKIFKNDSFSKHYHDLWGDFLTFSSFAGVSENTTGSVKKHSDGFVLTIGDSRKGDYEALKETVLHEVQHIIQSYNDFALGGNVSCFFDKNKSYENYINSIKDGVSDFSAFSDDAREAFLKQTEMYLNAFAGDDDFDDDYLELVDFNDAKYPEIEVAAEKFFPSGLDSAGTVTRLDQYLNLAGEIEARLVEKRKDMTMDARRENLPVYKYWKMDEPLVIKGEDGLLQYAREQHNERDELYNPKHVVDITAHSEGFAKILLDKTVTPDSLVEHAVRFLLEMHSAVYDELEEGDKAKEVFDILTAYMDTTPSQWSRSLSYLEREKKSKQVTLAFIEHISGDDAPLGLSCALDTIKEFVRKVFDLLKIHRVRFDRPDSVRDAIKDMFSSGASASLDNDFQRNIFDSLMASNTVPPVLAMSVSTIIDAGVDTLSKNSGIPRSELDSRFPISIKSRVVNKKLSI